MAYTYSKLATYTVGSGGVPSINFIAIPQNYTDLHLVISLRETTTNSAVPIFRFNNLISGYVGRELVGNGTSPYSDANYGGSYYSFEGGSNASSSSANVFTNTSLYIHNYTSNNYKTISTDVAYESNTTFGLNVMSTGLLNSDSAINSIQIIPQSLSNWAQYSTAHLYGIKAEV